LSPHTGDVVTVSITVTNQPCPNGGTGAGAFHIGFYFSTSSSFSGVTPFYEAAVSGCAANGTAVLNQNITMSAAPGIYYLGYKINDEDEVTECNTGDNGIFYWTITVLPPPQPDLTKGTDNFSNLSPHAGDTITASLTITNEACTGGSTNAGAFHIGYYFSTSSSFSGATPFYEEAVNGCPANGTVSTNLNITINPTTTPGTYYLGYKIDDENEIAECNEGNNGIYYWTISVLSALSAPKFGGVSASGGKLITSLSGLVAGEIVILQVSTNLQTWTPIQTNNASGSALSITNTINPSIKSQFFRAGVE